MGTGRKKPLSIDRVRLALAALEVRCCCCGVAFHEVDRLLDADLGSLCEGSGGGRLFEMSRKLFLFEYCILMDKGTDS